MLSGVDLNLEFCWQLIVHLHADSDINPLMLCLLLSLAQLEQGSAI